jgi:tRNA(Arg) A34 adenosine deaminase TadA
VGPDHETVLMEQGNIDTVNHAESTLARIAATNFTPEYLWRCTLYTSVEPCCMCAGTAYWANVGRIVYGITEAQLLEHTGNHGENPTMDLPCRRVFAAGQKKIQVIGPVEESSAETVAMQRAFWARSVKALLPMKSAGLAVRCHGCGETMCLQPC